ncbi:histone deacetylase [Methanosalsum natronophilum]|uniref:Histone deacetylase domain-containing protein n=1 Tax=Methanosalsum natronophilum TaxID=768733 RepID=A0A3R7XR59_9EURY|nr:histone deacetylase [Methanosalsum natronophilum]MCS3922986.1 acetoin utilization deacetylase AcuC-like enzyme [Methanosalsum natronophilum]RQD81494.1 MAG: hypothetical protein D5R95_08035 [Methanosalsum natronophilum]
MVKKSNFKKDNIKKLNDFVASKFDDHDYESIEMEDLDINDEHVLTTNISLADQYHHQSSSKCGNNGSTSKNLAETFQKKINSVGDDNKICSNESFLEKIPKIAIVYDEYHSTHTSSLLGIESPENPQRLFEAYWYLKKNRVFEDKMIDLFNDFEKANEKDIMLVHSKTYLDFLKSYASKGGGFLGDSTYITESSYNVALKAVGGSIKAAELVIEGSYYSSFALVRPPGHHAGVDKYSGFCLLNNGAILARYLQKYHKYKKILILDWDAHSGNGTMDIFYQDPTVMTVSIHHDPRNYYPRTGFSDQLGDGKGKGYTLNIEMAKGAGDKDYQLVFNEIISHVLITYSPDFIICCCGFDGYYKEKNNKLNMTSEGYYEIGYWLKSNSSVPFVVLLEGGYHKYNGQLCHSFISGILGRKNPFIEKNIFSQYEKNMQKNIYIDTQKNLSKLKKLTSFGK